MPPKDVGLPSPAVSIKMTMNATTADESREDLNIPPNMIRVTPLVYDTTPTRSVSMDKLAELGGIISAEEFDSEDQTAHTIVAELAAAEVTFANEVLAAARSASALLAQELNHHQGSPNLIVRASEILGRLAESASSRRALLIRACADGASAPLPQSLIKVAPSSTADDARGLATPNFLSEDGTWSDLPASLSVQQPILKGSAHVPAVSVSDGSAHGATSKPITDVVAGTSDPAAPGTPISAPRGDVRNGDLTTPVDRLLGSAGSKLDSTPGTPSYATTGLAACRLQCVWRGRLTRRRLGRLVVTLRQRGRTAQEFIQSEVAYLDKLQMLINRFFLPLQVRSCASVSRRILAGSHFLVLADLTQTARLTQITTRVPAPSYSSLPRSLLASLRAPRFAEERHASGAASTPLWQPAGLVEFEQVHGCQAQVASGRRHTAFMPLRDDAPHAAAVVQGLPAVRQRVQCGFPVPA